MFIENGEELGRGNFLIPPDWYSEEVDGYPITSILTRHNDQLVGSVYEWCSLFNTGEQCKFCVIDKSQKDPRLRRVDEKLRLILEALSQIPRDSYRGIGLNGGMTFTASRGLEVMTSTVEKIRELMGPDVPIAVEMTPPQDLSEIERFAEAGGTSLMMNLETWDPDIRGRLIPGKSKYCPRDSYFRAFEKAVELLGRGKVSTCFVMGTEPVESLVKGIKTVIDYDVIPSPLAGRCFEQFPDYPSIPPTNWRDIMEVFRFTRKEMAKKGLASKDTAGCIACGMCDIIGDEE